MIAVGAGAAHSWIVPVKVALLPRQGAVVPVSPTDTDPQAIKPPDPSADDPKTPVLEPVPTDLDPATLGQFISLAEARALFEGGTLFIDTRLRAEYDKGHILGALHLSTVEFGTPEAGEVLALLSADTHYVLYCEGGDCDASENVAIRLQEAYPLYHIMKVGYEQWKDAGYDVELPPEGTP